MRVDFAKHAQCFSVEDEQGEVIKLDFWELHPGSEIKLSEFGCTRREAAAAWDTFKTERGRYIPRVAHLQLQKKASYA